MHTKFHADNIQVFPASASAVSRTESFRRRVKGNWDKRSGAEDAETRQVF
jgi:hypothetical protein